MTAPTRLSGSLEDLTVKELEILHLLTTGHTVKSIAARLGRSEASINERLRDARRKTGIGSSRELARLVEAHRAACNKADTQENWDRNIDLSVPQNPEDELALHVSIVPSRSKGRFLMLIAIPLAAGLIIMAAGSMSPSSETSAAQATDGAHMPLAGSWLLDVARIPAEERPRRVTMTFSASPDGKWSTLVEIVSPDGSTRQANSTAALDGVPVPVNGTMDFIDTVALRQPSPDTLVMTLGKDGNPVSTRVYTVAKDKRSMTETIVWSGNGMQKQETTYFKRIG